MKARDHDQNSWKYRQLDSMDNKSNGTIIIVFNLILKTETLRRIFIVLILLAQLLVLLASIIMIDRI